MARTRIKQGNVSPIWKVGVQSFDADGNAIEGQFETLSVDYTCKIEVPTAIPPLARTVTRYNSSSNRFLVQLTGDETDTMAKGKHTLAIEVENTTTTPEFRVEEHIQFFIDDEIIEAP